MGDNLKLHKSCKICATVGEAHLPTKKAVKRVLCGVGVQIEKILYETFYISLAI